MNPVAVSLTIINFEDHTVLLQHRAKDDLFLCPGGKVDENEELIVALQREINEELGVSFHKGDIRFLYSEIDENGYNTFFYYIDIAHLSGKIRIMEPDKCKELIWYAPNETNNELNTYKTFKKVLANFYYLLKDIYPKSHEIKALKENIK